jgi:hypothetical protein
MKIPKILNNIFQFARWPSSFKKQLFFNILELYKRKPLFCSRQKEKGNFFHTIAFFLFVIAFYKKKKQREIQKYLLGCLDFITRF